MSREKQKFLRYNRVGFRKVHEDEKSKVEKKFLLKIPLTQSIKNINSPLDKLKYATEEKTQIKSRENS